jgi:hypothetical protein
LFYSVVAGTAVLAKQRRNLFDQQILRFLSHVVHVLRHNLLGQLHLLLVSGSLYKEHT